MMEGLLPRKLRVLRAERGLTLRQAATLTGVAKETLSDLERGTRHPQDLTLAKIAQGYNVPVEELLEEPVLSGKAEAPEAEGLTDEEIARISVGLLTPGTTSEADLKKLAQHERGLTVILALEELCDHAEL